MRIRLIIEDQEYCSAFKNVIASKDKDIFVELGSKGVINGIDENTIIVTDVNSERVDKRLFSRTLFLSQNPDDFFDENAEKFKAFKYSGINQILSYIEELNYIRTGDAGRIRGANSRVYAVCADSADRNAELCRTLARQILFRHGGEILILPIRYINTYFDEVDEESRNFSRMMYYLKIGREFPIEAFTYRDSYGISYLRLPRGINPLSNMNTEDLFVLLRTVCAKRFDTLVIDIADCFSETNIELINKVDNIVFFDEGKNSFDIHQILDGESNAKCTILNTMNQDKTLELQIDDYVRKQYAN